MPGSATALRQERLKKTHARPVPLGLFTINEEDEQQKNGHSRRPKGMHQPYPVVRARPAPRFPHSLQHSYKLDSGARCVQCW